MSDKVRILVDLKPVLDGYAGIPQETRLLFAGLRQLKDDIASEGLLQHGASTLFADYAEHQSLPLIEEIQRKARTVISFYTGAGKSVPAYIRRTITHYAALQRLRWQACRKEPLALGQFGASYFEDFIWSRCFSKTLRASEREKVVSSTFRVLSESRKCLQQVGQAGVGFGCKPHYLCLDTRGYDFFLAQTPFPGRVLPETTMIVRYHDAIPVFMPHTTRGKGGDLDAHISILRDNVTSGAFFSCISEATRADLLRLFPEVESRSSVIPNIVSSAYFREESPKEQVAGIVYNRAVRDSELRADNTQLKRFTDSVRAKSAAYLLMVSTIEPRKNHQLLIAAWERLKYSGNADLKLILVGETGWDCQSTFKQIAPWIQQGELFHLTNVTSDELRVLYRHATATVCPSLAEGFDYAGVEAMRSGGVVIASDIAVHREVYKNAALYFDPYDSEEAASVIQRVIADEDNNLRQQMLLTGQKVSDCYTSSAVLPLWKEYLFRLKQQKTQAQ